MSQVLVVDDSQSQLAFFAAVLEDQGWSVATAEDGAQALERLGELSPDLVVTDMQMPNMDGLELIRRMGDQFPMIPAVLLTGFGSEQLAGEALSAGAVNYLSKDHVHTQLADTVRRVLAFVHCNNEALEIKGALVPTPLEFITDCSVDRITPLVGLQLRLLTAMQLMHTCQRIRIAETLHYLLFHLVFHENLEQPVSESPISMADAVAKVDSIRESAKIGSGGERMVRVRITIGDKKLTFQIKHQGVGDTLARGPLPGTPRSFSDERGRAMSLLTSVLDEVFFGRGGDITLVKNLR